MKTYQKVYEYPGSGGTEITIDVILNTGTSTDSTGSSQPTSSVEISFSGNTNRTDGILNNDLEARTAQIQADAEAYIDGLNDAAIEGWLIDNGYTQLTSLSTPANVLVVANGSNAVDVKSDPVTNATSYLYEISENAAFKGIAGSHTQATSTNYTFSGLTPSTTYYARVKAMADGYGESDYGYGNGSTDA